jgi:hypothetical protein
MPVNWDRIRMIKRKGSMHRASFDMLRAGYQRSAVSKRKNKYAFDSKKDLKLRPTRNSKKILQIDLI